MLVLDQHYNVLSAQFPPTFMNSQEVPLLIDVDGRKDYWKNAVNVFLVVYSDDKKVL